MYAIVEIGGNQWKVEKEKVIRVPKIDAEDGKTLNFSDVLLVVDKEKVRIGTPFVKEAVVTATVMAQGKDKKVMVFKKKRRKNYQVLKGHRQDFTALRIDGISVDKAAAAAETEEKKPAAETGTKQAAAPKAEVKKASATAAAEKPAAKKPAVKPAAKKAAPAKPAAAKKTAAKKAPAKAKPAAEKPAGDTAAKTEKNEEK